MIRIQVSFKSFQFKNTNIETQMRTVKASFANAKKTHC